MVIVFILVDVMDHLVGSQLPPDHVLHDSDVLTPSFVRAHSELHVSARFVANASALAFFGQREVSSVGIAEVSLPSAMLVADLVSRELDAFRMRAQPDAHFNKPQTCG